MKATTCTVSSKRHYFKKKKKITYMLLTYYCCRVCADKYQKKSINFRACSPKAQKTLQTSEG